MRHSGFVYLFRATLAALALVLGACGGSTDSGKADAAGYRDLEWYAMVPKDEIEALKHPPAVDHSGSMRAQQVQIYDTVPQLDGQKVRLAGYIVPLEADDKGNLTEFFLVPYYGACIHVPPPPPNQIVYVKLEHGVEAPEITDPYGVKGVLRVHRTSKDLAGSAYTLEQATIAPWQG